MLFLLSDTAHTAHAAHEAGHHAAEHAEHAAPHVSSWIQLLAKSLAHSAPAFSEFLTKHEIAMYTGIIIALIAFVSMRVARGSALRPTRGRLIAENVVGLLEGIVTGVLGPAGKKYTPFLGTLFIYIFVCNMFGLVPLQNSIMSFLTTTAPIAISVFFYVQWIGIKENGLKGYLFHLAGSPKELFGYILVPLNLPLHVLGEFIKPLSLSFRLYGNIMAGHILLGVFLMLGIQLLKPLHIPAGVPLHFPFLLLEVMVGAIQAFVFTLLSTVYIAMMLPHDDHEHGHEEHGEHHAAAHAAHSDKVPHA